MDIPPVVPVRQTQPQPAVADVTAEARRLWQASGLARRVRPGDRIAVGVGSRGVANLQVLTRATLDVLRDLGAKPFVVAAMGSHGGATADGQRELLASYGVSEAELGVPVRTDMTAVQIGTNSVGDPVWWDKNALEADAVVTVSRVKPHTDFHGRYESGVVKMLVIGLGKREGAATHHRWGVRGLRDIVPESAKVVLDKTPFVAALAVLENAHEQTARLQVVERDEVFAAEPGLLDEARRLMGRLPFDQIDLLVIGETGKNYSGTGMDPNVLGRLFIENAPEPESPRITRVCVLDLSPESHGNATGLGLADLMTARLLAKIDWAAVRMNMLTACCLLRAKTPFDFPTDRACVETGLASCWQPDPAAVRLAVIPNTLEVAELWVTEPLAAEARTRPHLEVGAAARPLPFDADGTLRQEELFPRQRPGPEDAAVSRFVTFLADAAAVSGASL